ncbi:MAG: M20/M25/M40 family metallo-hydrolase [Ardenticatenia bacterium]|nr:MAG: M20/M25/M40 family metallo-hydrolase [Ardenticatenia bacterium]
MKEAAGTCMPSLNPTTTHMLDTIRFLSVAIGPRPSASPAERRAAEWAADHLQAWGYTTHLMPVAGLRTFTAYTAPIYMLGALGAWALQKGETRRAVQLSALAGGLLYAEQTMRPILSELLPRTPSVNVVARRPATRERRRTVVLTAHLDSQQAALLFHPRLVGGWRRSYLLLVLSLVWGLVGAPLGRAGRTLARLALGNIGVALGVMLHKERMPHVDGANDNASGVAVVLAAAQALQGGLPFTDVWVVLTGCEETGSQGMQAFLEGYRFDPDTTFFINCDTIGIGQVAAVSREGPLKRYHADPHLLALVRRIAATYQLPVTIRPYHLLPTDAEVAMQRGYRAISLMAFDEAGRLPNWHWMSDTISAIQPATLDTALALTLRLVHALDTE